MTTWWRQRRYPLHIHITSLFLLFVMTLGVALAAVTYWRSSEMLNHAADDLFERAAHDVTLDLRQLVTPAQSAVDLIAQHPVIHAHSLRERLAALPFLRTALDASPDLTSVYLGDGVGDFLLLRPLPADSPLRAELDVPPEARYLAQSVDHQGGRATGTFVVLDGNLNVLRIDDRPDYVDYDPRARPWYDAAQVASGRIMTPPYVFFTTRETGTTLARPTADGGGVVGADITLAALSTALSRLRLTPGTEIAVATGDGVMVAYPDINRIVADDGNGGIELASVPDLGAPVLTELAGRLVGHRDMSFRTRIQADGTDWRVMAAPLAVDHADPLWLMLAVPDGELLAAAREIRTDTFVTAGLLFLLAMPITLLLARAIARPIRALAGEAEAIHRFEFADPIAVRSMVSEVDDLSSAMDSMKRGIRRFLDIGRVVAAERDFASLLPRLLDETQAAAAATGGILYLVEEDGRVLRPMVVRPEGAELPDLVIAGDDLPPAVTEALAEGRAVSLPCSVPLGFAPVCRRVAAGHALVVPLHNRQQELLGLMVLLREGPADAALIRFVEAVAASCAVTLEARRLIHAQKALFESFIQVIATAIDAKNPTTGGHCARVPELTTALARAAEGCTDGPYRDFQLSEEEWEAVHVAAWLHDCGKVATPEYVVDKATKLETLHDRIHEIRTRFEVVKREAEVACWRAIAEGGDREVLLAELAAEWARLDADFAFVATCNQGSESMDPERTARLRRIAERTWTRTLDDRLGVSRDELARRQQAPAPDLPVAEPLIVDRPDHVIPRPAVLTDMGRDLDLAFQAPPSDALYNRGELHNLTIPRGTLTPEERYVINEHINHTIVMLSRLPLPPHLRDVPEIAGIHHERMDGQGYPRGLTADDMTLVGRMVAIADVFEALTAGDRPYKSGKTLSEALGIMKTMARTGHLDPELLRLFLDAGIWRRYAEAHLAPEQIDVADHEQFLP